MCEVRYTIYEVRYTMCDFELRLENSRNWKNLIFTYIPYMVNSIRGTIWNAD